MRFGEMAAGDVMAPAGEMAAIDADAPIDHLMRLFRRTGNSHRPACEGKRSRILGLSSISVWELVEPDFQSREVRARVTPAYFVPAQQPLVVLLPVLRGRYDERAIVVDEFGSAIGMITVDRILETVVGSVGAGEACEKHDDLARPNYETLADDNYLMDYRLAIPEVNPLPSTTIPVSEARTIGGLIVARLRLVPAAGEVIDEAGLQFTVVEATDRAVIRLRAERLTRN